MVSPFAAMLCAPYGALGRPASLTLPGGQPQSLRVLDETEGKMVSDLAGDGGEVMTVVPVATVRRRDVPADPSGGTLLLDGVLWSIAVARALPVPGGDGEWELHLMRTT